MAARTRKGVIRTESGSFRLIKPLIGYQDDIQKQIKRFPFEKNVFLMMRFREKNKSISDYIIKRLAEAGLNGVRADQPAWNITNDVCNPFAVLYCCKYGIALFDEAEENQAYNPNVTYELGFMHSLERKCMILRNASLPPVPFDLIRNLYAPYEDEDDIGLDIAVWMSRIMPERALSPVSTRATAEAKLEHAAVSAQLEDKDSVIEAPESISATELSWQVVSRDDTAWKLRWSMHLTNKVRRTAKVKVQVLFLDEQGFALDEHTSSPLVLPPGGSYRSESTTSLSPDLASRVRRAVAVVIRLKN